jgi:hypothetical protein
MVAASLTATPGTKMMYLIRRKPATTREALFLHWFANHMPLVIRSQEALAKAGKPHARRYIATLFDADGSGVQPWDGVAQLWWDRPLPRPAVPHGTQPTDTFQQVAQQYVPWATTEYVVIDGSEHLPVTPLTLNPPYPCTRSGFFKITFLVKTRPGTDFADFFAHWLGVHVPNVAATMVACGGLRYVVSQSIEPQTEPYAGMAELYFRDEPGWSAFRERLQPDGIERSLDLAGMHVLTARTELIGLP